MSNYPTIVNNVPKETKHYSNSLENFALIDNQLAAAQRAIGESSNLAQIALTYTYNYPNEKKYSDYVCILATLAQISIDSAKRTFDINIIDEIKRIKQDLLPNSGKDSKYPKFWERIKEINDLRQLSEKQKTLYKKNSGEERRLIREIKKKIADGVEITDEERKIFEKYEQKGNRFDSKLKCPMNYIDSLKVKTRIGYSDTYGMERFFKKFVDDGTTVRKNKKIEDLIQKYSISLYNASKQKTDDGYLLLQEDFDSLIDEIRSMQISNHYKHLMSWLIDRAFFITPEMKDMKERTSSKLYKNRSALLKVLYTLNKDVLLECFSKNIENKSKDCGKINDCNIDVNSISAKNTAI